MTQKAIDKRAGAGTGKLARKQRIYAVLSVIPAALIIAAVKAYPIVSTIWHSFTNWNGLYRSDFVGLENYRTFISTGLFSKLLGNSLFLLISVPAQVLIGILVAVLLYEKTAGWKAFRSIFYIPQIISLVILGYLFKSMFSQNGPINQILLTLGFIKTPVEYLAKGTTALPVLTICITWYSIGWQVIMILGGMSSIDPQVFEAARIDGAGFFTRVFKIIIPMISNTLTYCVVMSVVWTFTSLFSLIYSMTNGGPGYETMTLDYMVYARSFMKGDQFGFACSVAVVLLIIVMIITLINLRISKAAEEEWG